MLSLSHWGMHPAPQAKYSKAWYDEVRNPPNHFDYTHCVTYSKLKFGPDLP